MPALNKTNRTASVLIEALLLAFVFALGFAIGENEGKKKCSCPDLQTSERLDAAICDAKIIDAVVTERIRITGRPNPPSWSTENPTEVATSTQSTAYAGQ